MNDIERSFECVPRNLKIGDYSSSFTVNQDMHCSCFWGNYSYNRQTNK